MFSHADPAVALPHLKDLEALLAEVAKDSTIGVVSDRVVLTNPAWTYGLEAFIDRLFFMRRQVTDGIVRQFVGASGDKLVQLAIVGHGITAEGATAIASLTNLHTLNLDNNLIGAKGATAIASLTNLHTLNLNDNGIGDDGATAIAKLTDLHTLNLNANLIGAKGATAIAKLTNLHTLDLGRNLLNRHVIRAKAATEIAKLTNLHTLNLNGNGIDTKGATAIAKLTNLHTLDLNDNGIGDDGATAIAKLTNLHTLHLNDNGIGDDGATAIAKLTNLHTLHLNDNGIGDDGATAIAKLTNLHTLNLNNNVIGDIVSLLRAMIRSGLSKHLVELDIRQNSTDLGGLPGETIATTHAQDIFAEVASFLEASSTGSLVPLNEAKMIVVGKEFVGKTSLINYLVNDQSRNPTETKTDGAVIHEKIETTTWNPDGSGGPRLNIWDFGGQEIQYQTHRFFLSNRSLYLVVTHTREDDDDDVYQWLDTIRATTGRDETSNESRSPVIVVVNKCDTEDTTYRGRIDWDSLQLDYPEVVAVVRTSCNDTDYSRDAIGRLRERIRETIDNHRALSTVRDAIPLARLEVKNELSEVAQERSVLEFQEYAEICDNHNITDHVEQRSLLGLLHQLGTIVQYDYQSDARDIQRSTTLLDPNWLTQAIYGLLLSQRVRTSNGKFTLTQVGRILDPVAYPAKTHEYIITLMEDIGLCYPIPDSTPKEYLLPLALASKAPPHQWPLDSLRFRYRYKRIPMGLVPRLIVQAHRNLATEPPWLTGGIFDIEGCLVLVKADTEERRIDIAVKGPPARRRSALAVIQNDFKVTHKVFPDSRPAAHVPLPAQPDLDVEHDHLIRLEQAGESNFWPTGADRKYTLVELLAGIPEHDSDKAVRVAPIMIHNPKQSAPIRILVIAAAIFAAIAGAVTIYAFGQSNSPAAEDPSSPTISDTTAPDDGDTDS